GDEDTSAPHERTIRWWSKVHAFLPVISSTPVRSGRWTHRGSDSVIRQEARTIRAGAVLRKGPRTIRRIATTEEPRSLGGLDAWKELYEATPERQLELFSTISGIE